MKRVCELCEQTARVHCESDKANLCWQCDAKVHSANFLVARHSRNLLCRVCQSPTPWSGAGFKLEPTFTNCRKCANRKGCDDEEDAEEEQEVVENQAVRWSPPLPPASESSFSGGDVVATKKRMLRNETLTHDDLNIRTPQSDTAASGADSNSRRTSTPPRKILRTDPCKDEDRVAKSPIVEAVTPASSLHQEVTVSAEEMPEYLPMSDRAEAVDLNLSLGLFSR